MKKEYITPSARAKDVNIALPIAASIPVGGSTSATSPNESKGFVDFIGDDEVASEE